MRIRMALACAAVMLALAGCGGTSTGAPSSPTPTAPPTMTAERLAEALPADHELGEGAEVGARCPGDPSCTDVGQDQTASISYRLPLPDGVEQAGADDHRRFMVPGGEYEESVWLRAWLHAEEASAVAARDDASEGLDALTGTLDTEPELLENGYRHGIRGTGSVEDLGIEGWQGFVRVLDASFVHPDGRVTEPRHDLYVMAQRGQVVVTIEASLTREGREHADAVAIVHDRLQAYADRLDGV